MRILHIITRMILGGAQENTLLSVLGQQAAGHEVCLLTGPTTGPEGSLVQEALDAGVDLVEVPPLLRAVHPLAEVRAYSALRRIIRERQPEVVHTHSSKAGILGRLAAWHENVPFVVHTIHGLPFHPYQNPLLRRVYIAAETFAGRRCHRILSVADAMTDKAVAAGVAPPEVFETVYSGLRMEPFLDDSRDRTALRRRWGLSDDDRVVGKVARLFDLKGHEYLLRSFSRLADEIPNARLFLVGDGTLRENLQQLATDLGIAERVVWAGLVPHEEVADAIATMDVVAHCSLREGLARVLPQGLLSLKPVVTFDVDGAREVVRDGETGWLIPPGDEAALTRALREALTHPEEARTRAERGRALCRGWFDWRVMCSTLLEIYRNGLSGN